METSTGLGMMAHLTSVTSALGRWSRRTHSLGTGNDKPNTTIMWHTGCFGGRVAVMVRHLRKVL